MELTVISSSSAGNCYILQNEKEALIIECGVKFDRIKEALGFNLAKVDGCILTHEDGDHAMAVHDLLKSGIDVYASAGTLEACNAIIARRSVPVAPQVQVAIGRFKIIPFDTKHDAAEPYGYYIHHPECGNVVFITDSIYSPFTFKGMNHVIIEANYALDIIDKKLAEGKIHIGLRNRIVQSHFSIDNAKDFLKANDLTQVVNIVLIHLSNDNSDEARFKNEVESLTGKNVYIASPGLKVNFNKNPF